MHAQIQTVICEKLDPKVYMSIVLLFNGSLNGLTTSFSWITKKNNNKEIFQLASFDLVHSRNDELHNTNRTRGAERVSKQHEIHVNEIHVKHHESESESQCESE